MGIEDISGNLYRLRKIKNISIKEISKSCGISRVAYSNIENGKSQPKSANLIKIAEVLDTDLKDILASPPKINSLRFRSGRSYSAKEKNIREQIIFDTARWLKDYNELEKILNISSPEMHKIKDGSDNPIAASTAYRKLLGLDPDEPVIDIIGLLGKEGIKFHLYKFNLQKMFGLSIGREDNGPAIIVNVSDGISIERRIFTSAHELGHLLLHKSSFNEDEIDDIKLKNEEKEANQFAGYFLLPQKGFVKEWEDSKGLHWVDAVLHIKRKYRVSYKTVLQRLVDMKLARAEKIYPSFTVEIKKKYNISLKNHYEPDSIQDDESIEPDSLSRFDFVEDTLHKLVRDAYEKDEISISRAAEILKLSIDEMRELNREWKAVK